MRPLVPLAAAAATAGAATLALELVLPRAMAPEVGVSLPIWTATIATVLAGLAIGSAVGGWWADRTRLRAPDGVAFLLAAAAWWLLPALLGTRTNTADPVGVADRIPLTLLLAAALPTFVLLGAVPTLLARAAVAADPQRPGRALGVVSAAGAAGSLLGVYATGFALLPAFPLTRTWAGVVCVLAATGAWRLLAAGRRAEGVPSAAEPPTLDLPAADGLSLGRAAGLAFAAGAALLVVEVAAARSAARLVGAGLDTWTAVLGAVLLGLAVGGVLGGRLADRHRPRAVVGTLLLASSLATAATAWTPFLLQRLALSDALPWTLRLAIGALLAFGPAAVALGATSTALARAVLPASGGRRGRAIGLVYAAGTAGCVLAAVGTAPVLCPLVGTRPALLVAALALAALRPLAGVRAEIPWLAGLAGLVVVSLLPFGAARVVGARLGLRDDAEGAWARESGYAAVRVEPVEERRRDGTPRRARQLTIDAFVHGMVDLDDPTWLGYGYEGIYRAVTDRVAPRGKPVRAFFVGGGAYVYPRDLLRTRPDAEVVVAEIDPMVTRAAREALGMAEDPGFEILHEDARTALDRFARGSTRFDFVYGDAFNDLSVPWHLATAEFAAAASTVLGREGVYVLNVIDDGTSARFLGAVLGTLRRWFEHVDVLGLERAAGGPDTFVVVASQRALDLDGLVRSDLAGDPVGAVPIVRYTPAEVDVFRARGGVSRLTDDYAPVEWLLAPLVRARGGRPSR